MNTHVQLKDLDERRQETSQHRESHNGLTVIAQPNVSYSKHLDIEQKPKESTIQSQTGPWVHGKQSLTWLKIFRSRKP